LNFCPFSEQSSVVITEYYEKALASARKTYGDEHPDVAIDWNNLGGAWDSLGEYKKAIEYVEKALKILKATLGPNHPSTKTVQNNLFYLQQEVSKKTKT
jgi:tetratricopeptide (TPR) repeat protein